jgi:hypothetical protein
MNKVNEVTLNFEAGCCLFLLLISEVVSENIKGLQNVLGVRV